MKPSRMGIARSMAVVAIVAVVFGAMRTLFYCEEPTYVMIGIGALPMIGVLAVALVSFVRRGVSRPFLRGFVAFGTLAVAYYIQMAWLAPWTPMTIIRAPSEFVIDFIVNSFLTSSASRPDSYVLDAIHAADFGLLLGLPQLAVAVLGGLLSRKFKVVVVRRESGGMAHPAITPDSH